MPLAAPLARNAIKIDRLSNSCDAFTYTYIYIYCVDVRSRQSPSTTRTTQAIDCYSEYFILNLSRYSCNKRAHLKCARFVNVDQQYIKAGEEREVHFKGSNEAHATTVCPMSTIRIFQ